MITALTLRRDTASGKNIGQCRARQLPAALKRPGDQLFTSPKYFLCQAQFFVAPRTPFDNARRHQLQHPSRIRCRDEMQGSPHRPGADDLSVDQRLFDIAHSCSGQPEPNAPKAAIIVLRLHRTQGIDYLLGHAELCAGNLLVVEPIADDVRTLHRLHRLHPLSGHIHTSVHNHSRKLYSLSAIYAYYEDSQLSNHS